MATYTTNGSQSDVQSKINGASDGDIVEIPSGSFTWSSPVTISGKGIHLRGAGSGRVIARSTSSVSVGTGSKSFTIQSGLAISNGDTLRIERTGTPVSGGAPTGTRTWMQGTVTSYSGTSLVMSIGTTAGGGTHPLWIVSTPAASTITCNTGSSRTIQITEDASHSVEVSGLRIVASFTEDNNNQCIGINPTSSGKPTLIHDCYFETNATSAGGIHTESPRGIVWNTSFASFPFTMAPLAIHAKSGGTTSSWTSASTMGSNDTGGTGNFYVEDCDFHAYLNACDFDDNMRAVWRNNLMNNAAFGTHGADTSDYGVRHYEIYDNTFIFNGYNDGNTFNLNWFFYLRGGTGVITDNVIPAISSTDYGTKTGINMTVMNLQRAGGPNGCWGANQAGNQYPAPRQVGMGRVTGSAGNDSITYVGDLEPLYIWNNTGSYTIGTSDYGGGACTNPDSSVNYIVSGRDYYNNAGAKSGYTKYTYPHPLRTDSEPSPAGVTSATINSDGTSLTMVFNKSVTRNSVTPTVSISGGSATLTYASGSGTSSHVYSISRTVMSGETGTISATLSEGDWVDSDDLDVETFSGFTITNNSTQTPPSDQGSSRSRRILAAY